MREGASVVEQWQTRKGSQVWIEPGRKASFVRCEGCGLRKLITGGGPVKLAGRRHAASCSK